MKQYMCVQVGHHKEVGNVIDEWLQKGWRFHTYTCSTGGGGGLSVVNHYMFFERGE